MKLPLPTILIAGAAAAVALWAQSATTPPSPPTIAQQVANRVARLTTLLDLTAGQQASATAIFTTEITFLASLNTSQRAAQTALRTAIATDDLNGITAAADTIGGIATQHAQAEGTGEAAFYVILTSDQQARYNLLGPGNGPGGPGPH